MLPYESLRYTPEELAIQVSNNESFLKTLQTIPPRGAGIQGDPQDTNGGSSDVTDFLTSEFTNNLFGQAIRRLNSPTYKILNERLKNLLAQSYTTASFQKYILNIFFNLYVKGTSTNIQAGVISAVHEEQMVMIATDIHQENSPGIFGSAGKQIEREVHMGLKQELDELEQDLKRSEDDGHLDSRYYVRRELARQKRKRLLIWRRDFKTLHDEDLPK